MKTTFKSKMFGTIEIETVETFNQKGGWTYTGTILSDTGFHSRDFKSSYAKTPFINITPFPLPTNKINFSVQRLHKKQVHLSLKELILNKWDKQTMTELLVSEFNLNIFVKTMSLIYLKSVAKFLSENSTNTCYKYQLDNFSYTKFQIESEEKYVKVMKTLTESNFHMILIYKTPIKTKD